MLICNSCGKCEVLFTINTGGNSKLRNKMPFSLFVDAMFWLQFLKFGCSLLLGLGSEREGTPTMQNHVFLETLLSNAGVKFRPLRSEN